MVAADTDFRVHKKEIRGRFVADFPNQSICHIERNVRKASVENISFSALSNQVRKEKV